MGDILKFPSPKATPELTGAASVNPSQHEAFQPGQTPTLPVDAQVFDVTQRIQDRQAEDRRQVKRVVLNEFISAHVYVNGRGLVKITLKDVNEGGLAFDIDERHGQFARTETLEVRFYLNHETYFKFNVQVAHATTLDNEGVHRHGCRFIGESLNNVALQHFMAFLQNISASLRTDTGDRVVSGIYS